MPEVSVVILNWNRFELTREAVWSALNQAGVEVEVIVVDNGSEDGSDERLAEEFQARINLIKNPQNMGFSPANNQAFKIANSDWIALLNNDAVADPLWLKNSLKLAFSDAKVGIVVPRIINYYHREKLDGIGVGFWLDGLSRARHRGEIDSQNLDREEPLLASGCACVLSRKMLEELNGFDPDFFAYSEDTDLGIRAFVSGWRCLFAPTAIVYHRYSQTSGAKRGYSALKLYYVERNRLWILFRYYPLYLMLASPITSLLRLIFQVLEAFFSQRGHLPLPFFPSLLSLLKAFIDAFISLPRQLKIRRRWLKTGFEKSALWREIFEHFIPLKQISRLD